MRPKLIDQVTERLIVRLHDTDERWSFSRIAGHLKMPKQSVIRKYKRQKSPNVHKKDGRNRKTSARQDRMIARKSREDPNLTAPEIRTQLKLDDITVRTVQNRLMEVGLFGRRPAEKPFISPKNVKERLKFAKDHQNWSVNDWKNVLWSDESKFNMIGNDGKGYVRRPVNKRFDPKYTKGTVKFGGGNIMVWGCFSWHGLGPLRLLEGKMDRFQY
uniref:Transposase Tc1-like domain-containing protein n=1 Tax=Ditylenchus dipsaci TaxID=166011 RepID=A0A915ED75_9BILA